AHLKPLTRLEMLVLWRTKVSDAGLEHLKALTQLKRLDLDGTQVTAAGVRELRKHLRKCTVHWKP
ncbi:MAG: hypothetical protein WC740_24345, partial [Verrucomicrobiia bacterium]